MHKAVFYAHFGGGKARKEWEFDGNYIEIYIKHHETDNHRSRPGRI